MSNKLNVLDFINPTKHAAILARTSTDDLTVELQDWLDACKAQKKKGVWPAGVYNSEAALYITRDNFETSCIEGHGRGRSQSLGQTTLISHQLDTPALIIQYGRGVKISNLMVIGQNLAPTSVIEPIDDQAAYLSPGVRSSRYSPHCGICIDATVGNLPPDDGYPGLVYENGAGGTADVLLENVGIQKFAVGLMCSPDGSSSQGDMVRFVNGLIESCDIGVSYGQGQSRACVIKTGDIGRCRIGVTTLAHGAQSGSMPKMSEIQFGRIFRLFEGGDTVNTAFMEGCYGEEIKTIGTWGLGGSSTKIPISISGCHFGIFEGGTKEAPMLFESHAPATFVGCGIKHALNSNKAFNVAGSYPTTFYGCTFKGGWSDNDHASVGNNIDGDTPPEFYNAMICTNNDNPPIILNDVVSQPITLEIAVFDLVIDEPNREISFTVRDGEVSDLSLEELIFWRLLLQGIALVPHTVPSMEITGIVGDRVTCTMLYEPDVYDFSGATSRKLQVLKTAFQAKSVS